MSDEYRWDNVSSAINDMQIHIQTGDMRNLPRLMTCTQVLYQILMSDVGNHDFRRILKRAEFSASIVGRCMAV